MVFGQLCAPALIYIVFSITQITMDSLKGLYNVAMVKLFISILFTILLNHLCQRGLGIISWIIVFIPFMLMSLITAILLTMFGLDPQTGKLKLDREKKQKELDAREKAILDYGMVRSKDDYMKMLQQMGYNNVEIVEMSKQWNPEYDETKAATESEKYRSGTTMNKLQSRILAEELYYIIRPSVNTNTINSGSLKDLAFTNGTMKDQFLNFCNVPIDTYTQDIYYNLNRLGVFNEADDEQPRLIRQAFESMKEWGSLRRYDGTYNQIQNAELQIYQEYRNQLTVLSSDWINTLIESYNTRVKEELDTGKYKSRCEKINSQLDTLASERGLSYSEFSFDDFVSFDEDAMRYGSREATQGLPTSCTEEMKKLCKTEIGGRCRPCSEKETTIIGGKLNVLCPVKCDNSQTSFADDNFLKCSACHLCAPDSDTGDGTIKGEWTDISSVIGASGKSAVYIPSSWDLTNPVNRKDWWTYLFGKTHMDYYRTSSFGAKDPDNPHRDIIGSRRPKPVCFEKQSGTYIQVSSSRCDELDSQDVEGIKSCDGDKDGAIESVYIYTVQQDGSVYTKSKPIWLQLSWPVSTSAIQYFREPISTGQPRQGVILRAELQDYTSKRAAGASKEEFDANKLEKAQLKEATTFSFDKEAGAREANSSYYLSKNGKRLFKVIFATGVSTINGRFYLKGANGKYVGKNIDTGKLTATQDTVSGALQFIKGEVPVFENDIIKKVYLGRLPSGEYSGSNGDSLDNYSNTSHLYNIIKYDKRKGDLVGAVDPNVLNLVVDADLIPKQDLKDIKKKFDQMIEKDLMSTLINFKDDGTFYKGNPSASGGINFENAYNDFNVKNKWINNTDAGFFTNSYNTEKTDNYLILPYPTLILTKLSLSQPLIIDFGQLVYINTMDIKSAGLLELDKETHVQADNDVNIDSMQTNFLDNSGNKITNGVLPHDGKTPSDLCTVSCKIPTYITTVTSGTDNDNIIGLGTQDIVGYGGAGSANPNGSCVCYEKKTGQPTNIGTITLYLDSNRLEPHTPTLTVNPLDARLKLPIGKVCRIMKITPITGEKLNINDIKFTGFKYTEGSQYIFSVVPYSTK